MFWTCFRKARLSCNFQKFRSTKYLLDLWYFQVTMGLLGCNSTLRPYSNVTIHLCLTFPVFNVLSLSRVQLLVTLWTVAYKAPLSMGFSRQEYWSGLPFPSPGDLPNPGIKPRSPALQADALPSKPPGKQKVLLRPGALPLIFYFLLHHEVHSESLGTNSELHTFITDICVLLF